MNLDYIKPNAWSILEQGWNPETVKSSESLFSIGNGAMGQRANFEERYSGETFQGSYIAGVYYPDKTKVGWWKNGYPEYFAKVLNAPVWIGIDVKIDGEYLDLAQCEVSGFTRELNMKEGWYERRFRALLQNGKSVVVASRRVLLLDHDEVGLIHYSVIPEQDCEITFTSYLDSGVTNEDANWEETFWEPKSASSNGSFGQVTAMTLKTEYHVTAFMDNQVLVDSAAQQLTPQIEESITRVSHSYAVNARADQAVTLYKIGGYVSSMNHDKDKLVDAALSVSAFAKAQSYSDLLKQQHAAWTRIWDMADIVIEGDIKAQQGIRFNIFQLNQTYLGKDARLNIGPKGFTGEKYGGSTYWDTEAYCLPFYMATKDPQVARNLLVYRYNHLEKAIENAEKLGLKNGAALYPMVTMNGEESHNEWEITFEEIHRNGAIAFAIFNYQRYTGDTDYVREMGLEVLIGIARFWHQRANYSTAAGQYMILGVTGPNEYENNINNNFYTNYMARWCMQYTASEIDRLQREYPRDLNRVLQKTNLDLGEVENWLAVAGNMYLPYNEDLDIYLQQDGFLDKEIMPVAQLPASDRPINQQWSWDRILRSCYIKQADTLQTFYFFEDDFSQDSLERHFDFYEPLTVHESSLSPCVHSVQAASLGRMDKAYEMYLRTSRLDLDDYNHEVEEGCHITSMAGTWMAIVEGFGGMRVRDGQLHFTPRIPSQWDAYSFKVNFRGEIVTVHVTQDGHSFSSNSDTPSSLVVNGDHLEPSLSRPSK